MHIQYRCNEVTTTVPHSLVSTPYVTNVRDELNYRGSDVTRDIIYVCICMCSVGVRVDQSITVGRTGRSIEVSRTGRLVEVGWTLSSTDVGGVSRASAFPSVAPSDRSSPGPSSGAVSGSSDT